MVNHAVCEGLKPRCHSPWSQTLCLPAKCYCRGLTAESLHILISQGDHDARDDPLWSHPSVPSLGTTFPGGGIHRTCSGCWCSAQTETDINVSCQTDLFCPETTWHDHTWLFLTRIRRGSISQHWPRWPYLDNTTLSKFTSKKHLTCKKHVYSTWPDLNPQH